MGLALASLSGQACGPSSPSTSSTDTGATGSTSAPLPDTTTGNASEGSEGSTSLPPPDGPTDGDSTGTTGDPTHWCNRALHELSCVERPLPVGLTGTTPLGPISMPWSYAGLITCGTCFGTELWSRLLFLPTYEDLPANPWDIEEGLLIDELLPVLGEPRMVTVELHVGGETATAPATITFDSIPTPELLAEIDTSGASAQWSGTLTIDAEGWAIDASFVATACAQVMASIPCE